MKKSLLLRVDDGFEGTFREIADHLNTDWFTLKSNVQSSGRYGGCSIRPVGYCRDVDLYSADDNAGNHFEGTADEIAGKIGYSVKSVKNAANRHVLGKYDRIVITRRGTKRIYEDY